MNMVRLLESVTQGRMLHEGEARPVVGTNKRYAEAIDKRQHEREVQRAFETERPYTLSDFELELDTHPLTTTPSPHAVWAWVAYPSVRAKVPARVIEWTPKAAKVVWMIGSGKTHTAWVWSSACTERVAPPIVRSTIAT